MLDLTGNPAMGGAALGTLAEDVPVGFTQFRFALKQGVTFPNRMPFPAYVGTGRKKDRCMVTAVSEGYAKVRFDLQAGGVGRAHRAGEEFGLVSMGGDLAQGNIQLQVLSDSPFVRYLEEIVASLMPEGGRYLTNLWPDTRLKVVPTAPASLKVRVSPGGLAVRDTAAGQSFTRFYVVGPDDWSRPDAEVEFQVPAEGADSALVYVGKDGLLGVAYGAVSGEVPGHVAQRIFQPLAQVALRAGQTAVTAQDITDLRAMTIYPLGSGG